MIAAIPPNEAERLVNLKDYQILDTEADKAFDDLTRVAAIIAAVPVAIISFIDETRQWYKAKIGTDADSVPRDFSFCSHAILAHQPTLVDDATLDVRFSDHPHVRGKPNLRFYGGFPLISKEGFVLGTLCIVDFKPKSLSQDQVQTLSLLAAQAVALADRNRSEALIDHQKGLMMQSAKLMALGQMTAEIVHEINNPLAIIHARASLMLMQNKEKTGSELTRSHAELILDTTRRINKIIKGLSGFIRNAEQEAFERVLLSEIIDQTLAFCTERCRVNEIELKIARVPLDWIVSCRPVQISQVLLNLFNNAIDAVSDRPEKWIRVESVENEKIFEIAISDSGAGISTEAIQKIFDPFFTTKDKGKGTGLGLSISKGILDAHQGSLFLDETAPHTRFVVQIPKRDFSSP